MLSNIARGIFKHGKKLRSSFNTPLQRGGGLELTASLVNRNAPLKETGDIILPRYNFLNFVKTSVVDSSLGNRSSRIGGVCMMMLEDCAGQGYAYHIVSITDLEKSLTEGIRYDDKDTYGSKYYDFHLYFDGYKTSAIPKWVERKKAIFASICFKEGHKWHSHSAVLRIKLQMEHCWVCNENLANFIYEPFILQNMEGFESTREYLRINGRPLVEAYWENSLSYTDNLNIRKDKKEGYDAELLVMHHIPPEDIECLYIISDHQIMSYKEWQCYFKEGNPHVKAQYNKYLQPNRISDPSNTSCLQ